MENLSLGDALALTRSGAGDVCYTNGGGSGSGYGNGFFGGDWAWIIILFLIFGWGGNNGFGNGFGGRGIGGDVFYGRNSTCATPADVYSAVDQQTLISKLDQQTYGLADSTYAINNAINAGFNGVQQTLCQGFNGLNVAYLQGTNSIQNQLSSCCCDLKAQLADCCCTTQRGLDGINYNMAMNTNALQQTLCNNTRDIIENANANYRAIHEELVSNKLEAKNDRIAELQAQVSKLQLAASQERQNNFFAANQEAQTAELIRRLGADCPVNAVVVQPNTPVTFPTNCCGNFTGYNNNGCGCNNNY